MLKNRSLHPDQLRRRFSVGLTCRAETLFRPVIHGQVPGNRDAVILKGQVWGLVSLVVGATQGHRWEQVKAYLAIRFGIFNRCAIFSWLQLVCIKAWDKSDMASYEMLMFSAEITWPHTATQDKSLTMCCAARDYVEKLYCSIQQVICCKYSCHGQHILGSNSSILRVTTQQTWVRVNNVNE